MKFIKSLICNCLCINNLFSKYNYYNDNNKNYNNLEKYKKLYNSKVIPKKYNSFKITKKKLLRDNLYFDVYNDNFDYNLNNKYKKYNDLTAEHIFPQSYIKKYDKAKFDMHNIYFTDSYTNNFRSNYKYVDEINYIQIINKEKYIKLPKNKLLLYNQYNNYKCNSLKIFIPQTFSRGIIARSIAYMKYIYEDIKIDNVINIDLLKKWNKIYPPSENEIQRNNIIKKYQGNNNIFIEDYLLIDIFL